MSFVLLFLLHSFSPHTYFALCALSLLYSFLYFFLLLFPSYFLYLFFSLYLSPSASFTPSSISLSILFSVPSFPPKNFLSFRFQKRQAICCSAKSLAPPHEELCSLQSGNTTSRTVKPTDVLHCALLQFRVFSHFNVQSVFLDVATLNGVRSGICRVHSLRRE